MWCVKVSLYGPPHVEVLGRNGSILNLFSNLKLQSSWRYGTATGWCMHVANMLRPSLRGTLKDAERILDGHGTPSQPKATEEHWEFPAANGYAGFQTSTGKCSFFTGTKIWCSGLHVVRLVDATGVDPRHECVETCMVGWLMRMMAGHGNA